MSLREDSPKPDIFNDAELTVCIDFADLETYASLSSTFAIVREAGVVARWLPLVAGLARISNRAPTVIDDDPLVAYKARRARARQIYRDIERQRTCELLDIALPVDDQVSDTTTVNLGLLYVNAMGGDAPAYIERWFTETYPPVSLPQSKLTDPAAGPKSEALASIAAQRVASGLQAAGVDLAGFDAFSDGSGAGELADLQDALLDMGVFASPAYVYQGERFQGRQHLPLVRWYLLGAVGTAPV